MEPLGLHAVLDNSSGITDIFKHALEGIRKHLGGVMVSTLMFESCQVSAADDRVLLARYQTTDNLQVTLLVPHGCINFRVDIAILSGSDNIMNIGPKTLRESMGIGIVLRAFPQQLSEVSELFAIPYSSARSEERVWELVDLARNVVSSGGGCLARHVG